MQVTRAGGYIPTATRMAEVVGAQAGGYTPGRVVSSPVGGVMNTAEDIKYMNLVHMVLITELTEPSHIIVTILKIIVIKTTLKWLKKNSF